MEKLIKKFAKAVDKMAGEVGKVEKKVKENLDTKTNKKIKTFIKHPGVIFDNYDKKISIKEIEKFLSNKGEQIAFSKILEHIVKLKIKNIFTAPKKKTTKAKKKPAAPKKKTTVKKTVTKKVIKKKTLKKKVTPKKKAVKKKTLKRKL